MSGSIIKRKLVNIWNRQQMDMEGGRSYESIVKHINQTNDYHFPLWPVESNTEARRVPTQHKQMEFGGGSLSPTAADRSLATKQFSG